MPPPLPKKRLGIVLGSPTANASLDVFIDPVCPFSCKIFKRLLEVHTWSENTAEGSFKINFFLTPQPWHPQSPITVEAAIAVQMIDDAQTIPYLERYFDVCTSFYDDSTYDKSRTQIHSELADIAEQFVPRDQFLKLLGRKLIEGMQNTGNETTQELKWLVKYHRSCGVHVTPTCFMNNIEAVEVGSGWTLEQWQEFLGPFL